MRNLFKKIVFLACIVFTLNTAHAFSTDEISELTTYLLKQQNEWRNNSTTFATPQTYKDLATKLKENKDLQEILRSETTVLQQFLLSQNAEQTRVLNQLKQLQQLPPSNDKNTQEAQQERILYLEKYLKVNEKAIAIIQENITLANQRQKQLLDSQLQLKDLSAQWSLDQKLENINNEISAIDKKIFNIYSKENQGNEPTDKTVNNPEQTKILDSLLQQNQIVLLQSQRALLELKARGLKQEFVLSKHIDTKVIISTIDTYDLMIQEALGIKISLTKTLDWFVKNKATLKTYNNALNLQTQIQQTLKHTANFLQKIEEALHKEQQALKEQLAIRHTFYDYRIGNWPILATQIAAIPAKITAYVKSLWLKIYEQYLWQEKSTRVLYWVSILICIATGVFIRTLLRRIKPAKSISRLSAYLYESFRLILYKNIPPIMIASLIIITAMFNQIPLVSYDLLMRMLLIWIFFRSLIMLARLTLLGASDYDGQDVVLYHRLKWLLYFGGWAIALMMLSGQLPLSLALQDLFNRLFMLFMLFLSLILWHSRQFLYDLFNSWLPSKRKYVQNVLWLVIILIPLILLTTALVGIVGYMTLAWNMSSYQAYLLLVVTIYVILRGVIIDVIDIVSEYMIANMRNGWLWVEVVVKPLYKILQLALLVSMIYLWCRWVLSYSKTQIFSAFKQIGEINIINVTGIHITCESIIAFLAVSWILVWVAKWTRELCFRWLYRNTQDIGVRNSLSVFTQYTIVLIGGFIALRVLGLDFGGMSMILGGFAVGMGFGLRDFASNIVGGLMLLIERPLREGDLITLGEYEGTVEHIGIRSMRISAWNNVDVLIPNAEVFNKAFINWTHQDNIIRVALPLKISRLDDYKIVEKIILDAVATVPEVLESPKPQIFMKNIESSLIDLELRFFMNIKIYSKFEIGSKILIVITEVLRENNIHIPIEQYDVNLNKPDEY